MNIFKKTFCRGFQGAFYVAMPVLPYKDPDIIDSIGDIPDILNKEGIKRPLVVTDSNLSAIGASKILRMYLMQPGPTTSFLTRHFRIRQQTLLKEHMENIYRETVTD